jgi:hypothetical protein
MYPEKPAGSTGTWGIFWTRLLPESGLQLGIAVDALLKKQVYKSVKPGKCHRGPL